MYGILLRIRVLMQWMNNESNQLFHILCVYFTRRKKKKKPRHWMNFSISKMQTLANTDLLHALNQYTVNYLILYFCSKQRKICCSKMYRTNRCTNKSRNNNPPKYVRNKKSTSSFSTIFYDNNKMLDWCVWLFFRRLTGLSLALIHLNCSSPQRTRFVQSTIPYWCSHHFFEKLQLIHRFFYGS